MPVSPDEDDYKRRERTYPLRTKHRATYRPRTKPNAKSRNSTKGDKGTVRQADRVLPIVRISNESNLYKKESEYESIDVWNRTDKNDDADNRHIFHDTLDNYYPFHGGLESVLARLVEALENNTGKDDPDVSNSSAASSFDDEDRCQKWLDNREKIERAFPGKNEIS